ERIGDRRYLREIRDLARTTDVRDGWKYLSLDDRPQQHVRTKPPRACIVGDLRGCTERNAPASTVLQRLEHERQVGNRGYLRMKSRVDNRPGTRVQCRGDVIGTAQRAEDRVVSGIAYRRVRCVEHGNSKRLEQRAQQDDV